jgi:hypothetical protein
MTDIAECSFVTRSKGLTYIPAQISELKVPFLFRLEPAASYPASHGFYFLPTASRHLLFFRIILDIPTQIWPSLSKEEKLHLFDLNGISRLCTYPILQYLFE